MLIIGCDFHPSFEQIAFCDTTTGECGNRRLQHGGEAEEFYRSRQGQTVRVGMEANGQRALVRTAAGRLWPPAVDRRSRPRAGGGPAQAEDRPARRRTAAAVAVGRAFSAAHRAYGGAARCPSTGAASASAGADADAGEEPVAGPGHERRGTAEAQTVERPGTGSVASSGVATLGRYPAPGPAGCARRSGWAGGGTGSSGAATGRGQPGGAALAYPSRGGSGGSAGLSADHPGSASFRYQPATGQLSGPGAQRAQFRGTAAAGTHQQAGQCVAARLAGRGGACGGALGTAMAAALSSPGDEEESFSGGGGHRPQVGGAAVVDVEIGARLWGDGRLRFACRVAWLAQWGAVDP